MDSNDTPFGYDAFRRTCPSHTVLEMLASKWVYLTVCALRRGRLRNGELARKLEGITPKMLTQTLRVLERDGLVRREVFAVIPPRVEYELTELGQNLAADRLGIGKKPVRRGKESAPSQNGQHQTSHHPFSPAHAVPAVLGPARSLRRQLNAGGIVRSAAHRVNGRLSVGNDRHSVVRQYV